ncbi:MAG: cytochrome c family protein [Pirellulales bacterium]|nr:cytochrome c family protein [Pirellulales bacterium]
MTVPTWSFGHWPLVISLLLNATVASAADNTEVAIRCDPAQVLGAQSCAKCHENEVARWKRTPHFATFEGLHRHPEAKEIARRLGFSSIKRNKTCVQCHYTEQQLGERVRVVAGVSCESCHGAAKNWIGLHNDYGGLQVTKELETPEHRQQRLQSSIAAGMNNPNNLYLVARQCLACHTTPNEELVNVGGHAAGSHDFELVAWSQGMVRHNFLRTGGKANATSTSGELRVMYVVGAMADLEASLRATAQATHKAPFGIASAQRAAGLKRKLFEINKRITNPHVQQAVDAALAVPLKLNRSQALMAAADSVGKAAMAFASSAEGSELAALDPLLPKPVNYKK